MQNTNEILGEIKQAVLYIDENAEVILFGSRARGDYHEESDWDIIVLTDKDQNDRAYKRTIRHSFLSIEIMYGIAISALIRNRSFWNSLNITTLYEEIKKDGMLL